jgi:hypothetical protein
VGARYRVRDAAEEVARVSDPNTEAREAFDAIILRAEEGDPRTDWLPTIALLAREGLAALEQAGRTLAEERELVEAMGRKNEALRKSFYDHLAKLHESGRLPISGYYLASEAFERALASSPGDPDG